MPNNKDIWLHEILRKKANKLVGVDIDSDGIEYARNNGYEILNENCEAMELGEKFDLIVMSDVIEHVDAPVIAIRNLLRHLSENGDLVITTPNATAGNVFVRALLRKSLNVYGDHVAIYYPEHFQAICERLNCTLKFVYLFDHFDKRSISLRIKSFMFQIMSILSPRLSSSMIVVINKK